MGLQEMRKKRIEAEADFMRGVVVKIVDEALKTNNDLVSSGRIDADQAWAIHSDVACNLIRTLGATSRKEGRSPTTAKFIETLLGCARKALNEAEKINNRYL